MLRFAKESNPKFKHHHAKFFFQNVASVFMSEI